MSRSPIASRHMAEQVRSQWRRTHQRCFALFLQTRQPNRMSRSNSSAKSIRHRARSTLGPLRKMSREVSQLWDETSISMRLKADDKDDPEGLYKLLLSVLKPNAS